MSIFAIPIAASDAIRGMAGRLRRGYVVAAVAERQLVVGSGELLGEAVGVPDAEPQSV